MGIPCLTALDTANALADSLMSRYTPENTEIVDINNLKEQKQKLKFTKMSACSNDYIYINCFDPGKRGHLPRVPVRVPVRPAQRRGAATGSSSSALGQGRRPDAHVHLDGSEGMMCGNGIRCVAKYIFDNGIAKGQKVGEGRYLLHIDTKSGVKDCVAITKNGQGLQGRGGHGQAELLPGKDPVRLEGDRVVDKPISIDGNLYRITCCSMGNPHCTVFMPSVDKLDLDALGPKFENDPMFPQRVNVGFVEVIDDRTLKARFWERGNGETMACGTCTCAAVWRPPSTATARRGGHPGHPQGR